jgi:hypothetical protein
MSQAIRRKIPASRALVIAGLFAGACSSAPVTAPPTNDKAESDPPGRAGAGPADPSLTGKVWLATDAAAAPGTIRIFVPDGTLVMDSCFETYRLAAWRATGDRRIEWREDTATIGAEITGLTSSALQLTLRLADETKIENYRAATAPYVCPDMTK